MAGNKYLFNNAGAITEVVTPQTSAGAGDAGKIPALDSAGKLDTSFMPVGIGSETDSIATSESLAAGDYVNIWNSTGIKVRKADGTTTGKQADGFVLATHTHPTTAIVYRVSQLNNQKTGMTVGAKQYLAAAGGTVESAPTTAGYTLQLLGVAISATEVAFNPSDPIILA